MIKRLIIEGVSIDKIENLAKNIKYKIFSGVTVYFSKDIVAIGLDGINFNDTMWQKLPEAIKQLMSYEFSYFGNVKNFKFEEEYFQIDYDYVSIHASRWSIEAILSAHKRSDFKKV